SSQSGPFHPADLGEATGNDVPLFCRPANGLYVAQCGRRDAAIECWVERAVGVQPGNAEMEAVADFAEAAASKNLSVSLNRHRCDRAVECRWGIKGRV